MKRIVAALALFVALSPLGASFAATPVATPSGYAHPDWLADPEWLDRAAR